MICIHCGKPLEKGFTLWLAPVDNNTAVKASSFCGKSPMLNRQHEPTPTAPNSAHPVTADRFTRGRCYWHGQYAGNDCPLCVKL